MKKHFIFLSTFASLLFSATLLTACGEDVQELLDNGSNGGNATETADGEKYVIFSTGDDDETRTTMDPNRLFYWTPTDQIYVYSYTGEYYHYYEPTNPHSDYDYLNGDLYQKTGHFVGFEPGPPISLPEPNGWVEHNIGHNVHYAPHSLNYYGKAHFQCKNYFGSYYYAPPLPEVPLLYIGNSPLFYHCYNNLNGSSEWYYTSDYSYGRHFYQKEELTACIADIQRQSTWGVYDGLKKAGDCGSAVAKRDDATGYYSFDLKHQAAYLIFQPYLSSQVSSDDHYYLLHVEIATDGNSKIAGTYPFGTGVLDVANGTSTSNTIRINCSGTVDAIPYDVREREWYFSPESAMNSANYFAYLNEYGKRKTPSAPYPDPDPYYPVYLVDLYFSQNPLFSLDDVRAPSAEKSLCAVIAPGYHKLTIRYIIGIDKSDGSNSYVIGVTKVPFAKEHKPNGVTTIKHELSW